MANREQRRAQARVEKAARKAFEKNPPTVTISDEHGHTETIVGEYMEADGTPGSNPFSALNPTPHRPECVLCEEEILGTFATIGGNLLHAGAPRRCNERWSRGERPGGIIDEVAPDPWPKLEGGVVLGPMGTNETVA